MNGARTRQPFGVLTSAIAVASAAVLLLLGLVIVEYGTRSYTVQATHDAVTQARILASTVVAALSFDDPKTGQEYVNALAANPNIEIAALYGADGRKFVAYARHGAAPETVPPAGAVIADDRLSVVVPASQGGRDLGSVYLQTVIEPTTRRLLRFGLIALLVTWTSLVLIVLTLSQRALARTNAELAGVNADLRVQIDEREKVEAALRQSQKMEAIGQLTGGVAHDFNNLLQVILGSIDTLRRRSERWTLDPAAARDLKRYLDAAAKGGERAAALTHQLLAFSRRQPLAPKPVDVNRLVVGMSDLLRRTLGETIQIETILAGGLWSVFTDPNQLENALLNLAVNARDAMLGGGHLTIETANAHLDEAYVRDHDEVKVGQYVVICVTDDGAGMEKDVVARAFEPFFTTKDVGQGTGLGLSQVYGFVKQSDGHIKIYSEPGEGTTVKLYLPRHFSAVETGPALGRAEPLAASTAAESILVVEDEERVRSATVEMLRELGYGVFEASDGRAALDLLDRQPNIGLLFTDVGLPGGMTGRQLADEARRLYPGLKVLFTTGYARNAIVHHGRLDPGVDLISKPFTYAALADKIREVLARGERPVSTADPG